jgi:HK97 family phage portal protein
MNPMKWFSNSGTLKEPEWWRQMLNPATNSAGVAVNVESAMHVSAVWACVRIISESIASLPIQVYERSEDGSKNHSTSHPLHQLLHIMPNSEQTILDLMEFKLSNVLLRGTAYSQVLRSGRGQIGEILPLYTHHMRLARDASGKLVYDYQEAGNSRVFSQNEIWRLSGLGNDGVQGLSPISLARESIGVAIAADAQAGKLFSNGMQVPHVFEIPTEMSDNAYERLKSELNNKHAGVDNAFKALILESGLTLKNIGMNAQDSQFLESRKFQIADIARWYRVPLHMLNELDKATFANIEHQSIEFVMHTLRPWMKRIELTMMRDLFTEEERKRYFVEFKIDALLRGDTKTRYEAYGKGINDGWLSRNEVRGFENLNPVDGLDEYLVPLNMSGDEEPTGEEVTEPEPSAGATDIVNKEVKAVLVEHRRNNSERFRNWIPKYYDRFEASIIAFGVDERVAKSYVSSHKQMLENADDAEAVCVRWLNTAAKELML